MQSPAGIAQTSVRRSGLKVVATGLLFAGLAGLIATAAYREMGATQPETAAQNPVFEAPPRPARTAAEETYAYSLWPIHAEVKQNAVKMTFAGLAYKVGDIKQGEFRKRLGPLPRVFEVSLAQTTRLQVPGSLTDIHADYVEAIRLYGGAARKMLAATGAGGGQEMVAAHDMSTRAATLILKVGEALWPGEYKPN
ncbi:MAG: hypothetical protein ABL878_09865 [Burkholderiales bacterium]